MANALTLEDAKEAKIGLVDDETKGNQAVHDHVIAMRSNRRQGTRSTKRRGEIRGSDAKPWRQKGTGRARFGSKKNPIWRGGGVVFGPRPRDFSKDISKSTRKLAFRKAFTERIKDEDVLVIDDFDITDGKTKSFVKAVEEITDAKKVLIIAEAFSEKTYLAGRNYQPALLTRASDVNTEQLLYFQKIVIVKDALDTLATRTSSKKKD